MGVKGREEKRGKDLEAATAKRMKIQTSCQRVNCRPLNVLFSDLSIYRLHSYCGAFFS